MYLIRRFVTINCFYIYSQPQFIKKSYFNSRRIWLGSSGRRAWIHSQRRRHPRRARSTCFVLLMMVYGEDEAIWCREGRGIARYWVGAHHHRVSCVAVHFCYRNHITIFFGLERLGDWFQKVGTNLESLLVLVVAARFAFRTLIFMTTFRVEIQLPMTLGFVFLSRSSMCANKYVFTTIVNLHGSS